jgi:hypothetical protein
MKIAKIPALLLIAAMVLSLASCTPKPAGDPNNTNAPGGNNTNTATGFVYVPTFTKMPSDTFQINNPKVYDGKLYFFGFENNDSSKGVLYCSINLDGTGYTVLDGYESI